MRPIGLSKAVAAGMFLCGAAYAEPQYTAADLVGHWTGFAHLQEQNFRGTCSFDVFERDGALHVVVANEILGVSYADEFSVNGRTLHLKVHDTMIGTLTIYGLIATRKTIPFAFQVGMATGYGFIEKESTDEAVVLDDADVSGVYEGLDHQTVMTAPVDVKMEMTIEDGVIQGELEWPSKSFTITDGRRIGNQIVIQCASDDGSRGMMTGTIRRKGEIVVYWQVGPGAAGGVMRTAEAATLASASSTFVENNRLEFALEDIKGNPVSLPGEALDGKVVLVDIWGTWCGPCIEETPHLVSMYNKYHDQGFEIVGVAMESSQYASVRRAQISEFANEHGMQYTLVDGELGEGEIEDKLKGLKNFMAFPTGIFIGKDGSVRNVIVGMKSAAALEQTISELLAE